METKVYIQEINNLTYPSSFKVFGVYPFRVVFGSYNALNKFILDNKKSIFDFHFEIACLNEKFPYPSLSKYKARIEKGAIIRDKVKIDDSAIILMGAVINYGASIGKNTMIDMNVVVGSGAIIKDNVHIGAGAVISGVMEPMSLEPVIIEDNCFIGANAVIKEGVIVRKNTIVGASSFVYENTLENSVYYGIPARKIRDASKIDYLKVMNNEDLRK